MIILGDRLLVSRVEEEKKKEGFSTVEVEDSFIYKGKVEQVSDDNFVGIGYDSEQSFIKEGAIVYFAKYSPHSQEIDVDGEKMKIIRMEDVLAVV